MREIPRNNTAHPHKVVPTYDRSGGSPIWMSDAGHIILAVVVRGGDGRACRRHSLSVGPFKERGIDLVVEVATSGLHPSHCQPRNRAVVDVVATGDLPHGLAVLLAAKGFLLLVLGELLRSAHIHAARLRPLAALAGARPDQVALELCEAAKHGQHQPPV